MADPVQVTMTLTQLRCLLDCAKFYQRLTNDLTNNAMVLTLQATLSANATTGVPVPGMSSVLGQSAAGIRGSAN